MHLSESQSREIPVHIESVKMRSESGLLPHFLTWNTYSAVFGRKCHSHKIESFLIFTERLVRQDGIYSLFCRSIKLFRLCISISFSNDRDINAIFYRASFIQLSVRRSHRSSPAYKNIRRIDDMCGMPIYSHGNHTVPPLPQLQIPAWE